MFTCPNTDLYSVYFDHEVPSPWDEKIKSHLEDCSDCQKKFAAFEHLHQKLVDEPPSALDENCSYQKLLLKRVSFTYTNPELVQSSNQTNWIHKKIAIPIPLVAVALALFLIIPPFMRIKQPIENTFAQNFKPILPQSSDNVFSTNGQKNHYAVMFNKNKGKALLTPQFTHDQKQVVKFRISEFATLYLYKDDKTFVKELSVRMPISDFTTLQNFSAQETQLIVATPLNEETETNK